MIFLLLLACDCSLDAPLVGGGVNLPEFAEPEATDTSDTTDVAETQTTTVVATVLARDTLDSAETPEAGGAGRGVQMGWNGPWIHLTLETDTGSPGDAWFIAGAPDLVAVGEVVTMVVEEGPSASSFSLSGADGVRRLWVGLARAGGSDPAAALEPGAGVTFAEGEAACTASGRCQDEARRDFVATDGDGSFTLPFGEHVTRDEGVFVHGGHQERSNVSTAFSCGHPSLLGDYAAVAIVAESAFASDALWP
ncbi:MAG: hypothetical protein Q8P41_11840 [Pseudomonadota bacterium]|nr:hypothetical protein [Pseudomonadota bacterium]